VRFAGNLIVAAFFAADKDNHRNAKREDYKRALSVYLQKSLPQLRPNKEEAALRSGPNAIEPFHWEKSVEHRLQRNSARGNGRPVLTATCCGKMAAPTREEIMAIEGTVVNGMVVFDGNPQLPEGARVRVELADADDDLWDELAKAPPPPPTETYEEHLESLRKSIAAAQAGEKGMSVEEAFAEINRGLDRHTNGEG